MIRTILDVSIFICQACAISMFFLKWCAAFKWCEKITEFFKKHTIIAVVYVICGSFGLFYTIAHVS